MPPPLPLAARALAVVGRRVARVVGRDAHRGRDRRRQRVLRWMRITLPRSSNVYFLPLSSALSFSHTSRSRGPPRAPRPRLVVALPLELELEHRVEVLLLLGRRPVAPSSAPAPPSRAAAAAAPSETGSNSPAACAPAARRRRSPRARRARAEPRERVLRARRVVERPTELSLGVPPEPACLYMSAWSTSSDFLVLRRVLSAPRAHLSIGSGSSSGSATHASSAWHSALPSSTARFAHATVRYTSAIIDVTLKGTSDASSRFCAR